MVMVLCFNIFHKEKW